jgi:hypothetical protein
MMCDDICDASCILIRLMICASHVRTAVVVVEPYEPYLLRFLWYTKYVSAHRPLFVIEQS